MSDSNVTVKKERKLLDQMRDATRLYSCLYRTEQRYVQWAKCCVLSHNNQHPAEMARQ